MDSGSTGLCMDQIANACYTDALRDSCYQGLNSYKVTK